MPTSLAEKENQTGALDLSIPRSCKRFVQVAGGGGGGGGGGLGYDMGLTSLHFNTVGTLRHFPVKNRCKYFSNFLNTLSLKTCKAVS